MQHTIALFGEAERGQWAKPHVIKALPKLMELLGNPPENSQGLVFAIQALLYEREVIYFRVQEEGFSKEDYFSGLSHLKDREKIKQLHALCLPGVGDKTILNASDPICKLHRSHLIMTEKDLYDYLTQESS